MLKGNLRGVALRKPLVDRVIKVLKLLGLKEQGLRRRHAGVERMVMLHDGHDIEGIRRRGEAFVRTLAELEKVLRSYGPDRGDATKVAVAVLLDGLTDADQAAE